MFFHKKKKGKRAKPIGPYKSGLEKRFADLAEKVGLPFLYEEDKIPYVVPSHYNPDFKIAENRYIETKGFLSSSNRQRMLCFQEQHPEIEICFLFGNADNKLSSKSKTTYKEWATKHGFRNADIRDGLPVHWWDKEKTSANKTNGTKKRKGRA